MNRRLCLHEPKRSLGRIAFPGGSPRRTTQVTVSFDFQARRADIALAGGVNHRMGANRKEGPEGRHSCCCRIVSALQA
jgi:hypothetical protein